MPRDGRPAPAALYEREDELAAIEIALTAARAGTGSLLIIEGTAGIGKTALLDEAIRRVAATSAAADPAGSGVVRAVFARGTPLEQELAHGVVRQLLEPIVRAAAPADRAALLAGAADLARPVVLPEVAGSEEPIADRRAPVVHGLYWLTANLAAQGPLLLAIDDLQWADPASLRYLAYLAVRLDGLPVVVVATLRTGESTDGTGPLAELAGGAWTQVIRPTPLSVHAVGRLVGDALPGRDTEELVAACLDATGGVPFLLAALLGALGRGAAAPTPAAVSAVTSATVGHATLLRLSRLGPAAVPVARAVAVLGRHATPSRIARLAGLDEAGVIRTADALAAADILRAGRPLTFVHPIVHASVYRETPAGERSLSHAAVAAALAAAGEPVEEVAVHLLAAEPDIVPHAADTLRAAASRALARGAPESAVAYLRRCLAETGSLLDPVGVLHPLARAEAMVGEDGAVDHFEQARRAAADPVTAATISLDLGEALMFTGHWDRAITEVDRALAALAAGPPDPDRTGEAAEIVGRLEVFRAGMMANDPRLVDAFERERSRFEALATRAGRAGGLMAALLSSCAVCRGEPTARVIELVDRGLDEPSAARPPSDADGSGSTNGVGRHAVVGTGPAGPGLLVGADADAWAPQVVASLAYVSELDRALAAATEMRAGALERGSVYGFVRASALRALVGDLRGDLRAAEADLRSAFDLSRTHQLMFSVPPLLRWSVDALLERPALADIAVAAQSIDLDPVLAESFSGGWLLEVRGRLRLAAGDIAGARADLQRAGTTMTSLHVTNPMVTAWRSGLALALRESDPQAGRRLADEEWTAAIATGLARPRGVALRVRGLLAADSERETLLREALDTLRDAAAPLEVARTELALGRTLRRRNRRSAAGEQLRSALDGAHHCGAERLAARAEQELRAIGARPRRRAISGPDSLTPSESRVAAAANAGMTNREIAQALFVTAKTVENQLGRIYTKLGIRGRDELAAALGPE